MAEQRLSPSEKRLQRLADRLEETLTDDEGRPAERDVVEQVVAEQAAPLEDAPIQEFVPLIVENKSRDELRHRGMTTDWTVDEARTQ